MHLKTLQIAGVAPDVQGELRRGREMDTVERFGELGQTLAQDRWMTGTFPGLGEFPFASSGSVRNRAGEPDLCAGKPGGKILQLPFVVREEPEVGLDVLDRQLPHFLIGGEEWPIQLALT